MRLEEAEETLRAIRRGENVAEHSRAEEVLRESEERFRKIFEEGPLGMAIVDLDYRFVKVNAMLSPMLGYTEQELQDSRLQILLTPEIPIQILNLSGKS